PDHRSADPRIGRPAQPRRRLRAAAGPVARRDVRARGVDRRAPRAPLRRTGCRLMLVLDRITLATPQRVLMRHLTANVEPGQVLTVMGESGAGKSSLLAYLAGTLPEVFEASGEVQLDGRRIDTLPTVERRVALLFQDDLLFPHMPV